MTDLDSVMAGWRESIVDAPIGAWNLGTLTLPALRNAEYPSEEPLPPIPDEPQRRVRRTTSRLPTEADLSAWYRNGCRIA